MDAPQSLHPTDQTLSSYGLGKLADAPAEAVQKHLEECSDCQRRARGGWRRCLRIAFLGEFGTLRGPTQRSPGR